MTASTQLILDSVVIRERFLVEHLDTSDRRTIANLGRWDATNVVLGLKAAFELSRRLRGQPGVVYLPLSQGLGGVMRDSLLIASAVRQRWRVAVRLEGGEFDDFFRSQPRVVRAWVRWILRRVTSVAVLSDSLKAVLAEIVPPERLAVVPNGVLDPGDRQRADAGNNVIILGNLRPRKGIRPAVEAALLVLEERPDARFLFVGNWASAVFEKEVRALASHADGRITFHQAVGESEKWDALAESALLLFPSIGKEGSPRVVLESMAVGIPAVATDRGAVRDLVIDGETGYVLADPDPERIAAIIVRLLDDAGARYRMGNAARARYLENFTQDEAERRLATWLDAAS